MKRSAIYTAIVFGWFCSASLAEAINIDVAEVQNGLAVVQGGKAASNSTISWEGGAVTTANKNGGFKFNGVIPPDCVGALSDGVTSINVAVGNCTAASAAVAPVPRTGQTTSYASGDDGALQKGAAWPNPRFTDNNNGTVTDNLTGLVWLKNANCIDSLYPQLYPNFHGAVSWHNALDFIAGINTGTYNCNDTSNTGSHQTDWRLPNVRELFSLLDYAFFCSLCPSGGNNPAIPNTAGTGQGANNDPFLNFVANDYWSSTTAAGNSGIVWVVDFGVGWGGGLISYGAKTPSICPNLCGVTFYVMAVRGGS